MQITYNKHCELLNVSLCLIGNTSWRNTRSGVTAPRICHFFIG